jgi:hypothetical protein
MEYKENNSSHNCDAITGERIMPGIMVVNTDYRNKATRMGNSRNRLVKEETIVGLAEAAGYSLVKRDGGNSVHAESVDGEDVGVGGGEAPVGEAPVGGKSAVKRRSSGKSKN